MNDEVLPFYKSVLAEVINANKIDAALENEDINKKILSSGVDLAVENSDSTAYAFYNGEHPSCLCTIPPITRMSAAYTSAAPVKSSEETTLEGIENAIKELWDSVPPLGSLGTDCYILEGKTPVACPNILKWGKWMQQDFESNRRLGYFKYKGVELSTVFLGLDRGFSFVRRKPPVVFETMIFSFGKQVFQELFDSYDAAIAYHNMIFNLLIVNIRRSRRNHKPKCKRGR